MSTLAPLWQIEDELSALVDSIDTCPDELRAELEERISQYLGHEVEKVDRIAAVLSSLDSVQVNAKAEIERLRHRQTAAQRAADRLSEYVVHLIRRRDGKPLKGRNSTLGIRKSEAVVIVDAEAVPSQWKVIKQTLDIPKDALRQALKNGQEIPGVVLEQREHLMRK
jgi:Siphovirus Gp157